MHFIAFQIRLHSLLPAFAKTHNKVVLLSLLACIKVLLFVRATCFVMHGCTNYLINYPCHTVRRRLGAVFAWFVLKEYIRSFSGQPWCKLIPKGFNNYCSLF